MMLYYIESEENLGLFYSLRTIDIFEYSNDLQQGEYTNM